MKRYNINNYVIYHKDLEQSMPEGKMWDEYTRDELIIKFMPLVENLARKFATSHQAIGILSINDLIQAGHIGLITAIDKLEWDVLNNSHNVEQTLKSFLSKRIKGTIRRYINANMDSSAISISYSSLSSLLAVRSPKYIDLDLPNKLLTAGSVTFLRISLIFHSGTLISPMLALI